MAGTFQVIITPAAEQDLEGIIAYLTENESYDRALTVRDEILEVIEGLQEMPTRHAPARDTYEFVGDYPSPTDTRSSRIITTCHPTRYRPSPSPGKHPCRPSKWKHCYIGSCDRFPHSIVMPLR